MKYLKLIKKEETTPTELESSVLYYDENTDKVSCKVAPSIETVDLGLSVNWMTCNIGATKLEEYGLLFQWGSTEGHDYDTDAKDYSTWTTAPFNGGDSDYDSTYFASVKDTVCPNGVLASQYDAAYQDLMEQYENPIEHACDMGLGKVFIANGWERPQGFCESAWDSVSPFVMTLAHGGGNFYDGWMKNKNSAMISCNDGFRPVSFLLEAMDEDAE